MVRHSPPLGALAVAAVGLVLAIACSGSTRPFAGGLMLAIQTDLAAPKDIAAVGLYIASDGKPIFSDVRDVAPRGEVRLPATMAILADPERPRAVIKIRAIAFKENGEVRVLRDIITTVPRGRTALLRAPLLWINEGSGTGKRQDLAAGLAPRDLADGFTRINSACPEGQTFLEGECADANIDSAMLPDYVEAEVFGGGDATGRGGRCFDVLGCFASATSVALDAAACTAVTLPGVDPNDPRLSLAVSLPISAGTGECNDRVCLVPLDKGTGWRAAGAGVTFPRALCARITSGRALGIVRTTSCAAKDPATPSCGPASSVSASGSTPSEGGTPVTDDFAAPVAFDAEPNLSSVAIDDDNVYLARAASTPPPPGVVRIPRADILAQATTTPAVLFGYANPQFSALLAGPRPRAQKVVARGEAGEIRVCTPTSSNDCPTFTVNGAPTLALGPTEAYAYGDTGGPPGVYSIDLGVPALTPRAIVPGIVTAMLHSGGTLYLGMLDGSIGRCAAPCPDAGSITTVRGATSVPSIVTALASDDRIPDRLFFLQVPADGVTTSAGGVFEIGKDGAGERQLAPGQDVLASPPPPRPPAAIAVDARYVYWGGTFDDPRGGGRKAGLLRRDHRAEASSRPLLETAQGTEPVSAIALDGAHVFWTFDRADHALLFARKLETF